MNKPKIAYWVSTGLLTLMYLGGSALYATQGEMVRAAYAELGYPQHLIAILMVVKFLAAMAILVRRPVWLSDLAYAGMFYHLLLAISAHVNIGDGGFIPAAVGLVALLVSFFTQNSAREQPSPYAGSNFANNPH